MFINYTQIKINLKMEENILKRIFLLPDSLTIALKVFSDIDPKGKE